MMKRRALRSALLPATLLSLWLARPQLAFADPGAGLEAGETLAAANAGAAEGLLPPEILDFYKKGDWANRIAEWPAGKLRFDAEFEEATKKNAERLALDERGGIIDKATGKKPEAILGFPFPSIDAKDPQAAVKILWNYFYGNYSLGSTNASVDLAWVSRKGLDRSAGLHSHQFYYDGQRPKYRPKSNPQNLLAQTLAKVEYPQDLANTIVLSWRFRESDKRDLNWTYLPALRRVREVAPTNRSDGFLGSDLTQDDGAFFDGKPEDFTWKLVGESEMYRLVDPFSLKGEVEVSPVAGGGWRTLLKTGPFVGFEDASWKGAPWAPLASVLARRKLWVVEGVPRDKYYLYGKLQLYVDQEGFQGAWSRKFSWTGELLADYAVSDGPNHEVKAADGSKEWLGAKGSVFLAAVNLKADRATVTGFPLKDRDKVIVASHVPYDPEFFDYQALQKLGK